MQRLDQKKRKPHRLQMVLTASQMTMLERLSGEPRNRSAYIRSLIEREWAKRNKANDEEE